MTAIIAMTGKKQSGKNTTANYLAGDILVQEEVIDKYEINENGELLVPTRIDNEITMGVLDLTRQDATFRHYAQKLVWPYVKVYGFAEPLKTNVCIDILGLTHEQCYGTDEEKDTKTHIRWENMPHYGALKYKLKNKAPKGEMTGREVMQQVGTEIFRKMYNDCWTKNCINRILTEKPKVAIICDCRFPNEAAIVKDAGGKLIRLLRNTENGTHESEVALDPPAYEQSNFDVIIDNTEITKFQAYQQLRTKLLEWGILS